MDSCLGTVVCWDTLVYSILICHTGMHVVSSSIVLLFVKALEVITYIGCGVSILGVLATIVIKVVNIKSLDYGDMQ